MDLLSKGQIMLHAVIEWTGKLTQREILPNKTWLLFSLFTEKNENL